MKKTLLTSIFTIMLSFGSFGQGMPVYDNTNFLAFGQQLLAMASQTGEIIKTVNFMADAADRIEQVNNAVRNLNTVTRLIQRNQEIYRIMNDDLRRIISNPLITPREATILYDKVERLWDITQEDVALIEQILTSNLFNMEDSERMDKIRTAERQADETFNLLTIELKDYSTIVEFREFQQAVDAARQ